MDRSLPRDSRDGPSRWPPLSESLGSFGVLSKALPSVAPRLKEWSIAITQAELDRVRLELETKITTVTVEHVSMAQAIGSYGERFTGIEARFAGVEARIDAVDYRLDALSADIDRRFDAVDRRFDAVAADMDRRFNASDRRFDSLSADMKAGIGRIDSRIDRLDTKLDAQIERLDSKLDARFNVQTVLMTVLGVLVLFGDPIRSALGV